MRPRGLHNATLAAIGGLSLLASACGGLFDGGDTKAGLSCVDDSPECVEQRQVTLKAMLADKDRTWVKEAPTPQALASRLRPPMAASVALCSPLGRIVSS